jgi:hypothetical protein
MADPIQGVPADYNHKFREAREHLSFEEAIEAEEDTMRGEKEKVLADEDYHSPKYRKYSYLSRDIYVDQLVEWDRYFDSDQFLVLKSEDFFENPQGNHTSASSGFSDYRIARPRCRENATRANTMR